MGRWGSQDAAWGQSIPHTQQVYQTLPRSTRVREGLNFQSHQQEPGLMTWEMPSPAHRSQALEHTACQTVSLGSQVNPQSQVALQLWRKHVSHDAQQPESPKHWPGVHRATGALLSPCL